MSRDYVDAYNWERTVWIALIYNYSDFHLFILFPMPISSPSNIRQLVLGYISSWFVPLECHAGFGLHSISRSGCTKYKSHVAHEITHCGLQEVFKIVNFCGYKFSIWFCIKIQSCGSLTLFSHYMFLINVNVF